MHSRLRHPYTTLPTAALTHKAVVETSRVHEPLTETIHKAFLILGTTIIVVTSAAPQDHYPAHAGFAKTPIA
jgi:hypothetical protein